ncbi:hypothetical protein UFOVP961_81 [uncultured Caudovirales phage]|nr:hypothetical protein UFOVP961_81 [uncultured Caudovirales phage]CAB4185076.1 hypothetical protein UFOVP1123_9 [uncultured Caudovirales phage]CAB4215775.1 hypothetical protein UFOVP1484_13 [uncultured Caudovirales phage]CAB5230571.1 hypothetical protein UFOVP1577_19 [uncultured Caudovirales phage]
MSLSIKEISQYAYEYALDRYEFRIQSEGQGNVLFYEIYDDKFAELIIQKCSAILTDMANKANSRDINFYRYASIEVPRRMAE